jgi:hypothetical protein
MDIRCHPNTLSNFFKCFTLTFKPFVFQFIFVNLVTVQHLKHHHAKLKDLGTPWKSCVPTKSHHKGRTQK